jgi:hypothetical protein
VVSIEDDEWETEASKDYEYGDILPKKPAKPDAEKKPTEKIIVNNKRGRPPQKHAAATTAHKEERPKRSPKNQVVKSVEPVFKKNKNTPKNTDIMSIEQIEAVVKKTVKEAMEGSSKLGHKVQQQGIVCVLLYFLFLVEEHCVSSEGTLSSLEVTNILQKKLQFVATTAQCKLLGVDEKKHRGAMSIVDTYLNKDFKLVEYTDDAKAVVSTGKIMLCYFLTVLMSLLILVTGVVTQVNKKAKTCTVSFDCETLHPMLDVSLEKIKVYLDQSLYFSQTGTVLDVIAILSKNSSRCTTDAKVCLTTKLNVIPVVLPYDFDSKSFLRNTEMVQFGDAVSLAKNNFDATVEKMSMEIVAFDDDNYYVSVLSYFFYRFSIDLNFLNRSSSTTSHFVRRYMNHV